MRPRPRSWAIALAALIGVAAFSSGAGAQEISVQATVDRRQVPANGQLQLTLQVHGTQNVEAPNLEVDGFHVRYVGPSTQVSIINMQMSSSVAHRYFMIPQREGTFTLGPFSVEVEGKALKTEPIEVTVGPPSGQPHQQPTARSPSQAPSPPPSHDEALRLQIGVDRTTAYLNQAIPARIQFLIGGVSVRGINLPELVSDDFLVKPIGQPKQSRVVVSGAPHTLLEFETVVTPLRTGTLALGPATILCQIIQRQRPGRRSSSRFEEFFGGGALLEEFFARDQLYEVSVPAAAVTIEVLPLPAEGRPAEFGGAVGQFTLDASAVPAEAAVGEPVTVTTTVRGSGNFASVSAPSFSGDVSQFKTYEPQQVDSADASEARQRVFEQVLIPLDPGLRELPLIQFDYFDPATAQYQTLSHGPIPLRVTPAPADQPVALIEQRAGATTARRPDVLGRDIIYIKERLGRLRPSGWRWYTAPGWLMFWYGFPLGLLAVSEGLRSRRARLAADPGAARAEGAMKRALAQCRAAGQLKTNGNASEFYNEIFRVLQRYIGDRFNLSSEGITKDSLEQLLRPRGAPEALVRDLVDLFDRCDSARYSPASSAADHMEGDLRMTESVLKRLERWRPA